MLKESNTSAANHWPSLVNIVQKPIAARNRPSLASEWSERVGKGRVRSAYFNVRWKKATALSVVSLNSDVPWRVPSVMTNW